LKLCFCLTLVHDQIGPILGCLNWGQQDQTLKRDHHKQGRKKNEGQNVSEIENWAWAR
jgi:hypothetical protein